MDSNGFAILPAHCFEGMSYADVPNAADYWSSPIGSGPHKINETAWPNYVTLTRFDDYHSAPASINNVMGYLPSQS